MQSHQVNSWLENLKKTTLSTVGEFDSLGKSNMRSMVLGEEQLQSMTGDDIEDLVMACFEVYSIKARDRGMIFYCWVDEHDRALKMSCIKGEETDIPLDSDYVLAGLEEIVIECMTMKTTLTTDNYIQVWTREIPFLRVIS